MPPVAMKSSAVPSPALTPTPRLVSLDALRGFAMFWLIGGSELFLSIAEWISPTALANAEWVVTHRRWHGYLPWDLVMPLFLFVVGASLPYAQAKREAVGVPLKTTYLRILRRVFVLWMFGILIQAKLLSLKEGPGLELFSNALQAIAIGYLVTSVALLHLPLSGQIGLFAALTLGYWALLTWVPFGGHPAGTLEPTVNLPRYVDEFVLGPFRRARNFTWIVSSLGFAASVLLGSIAGHILRNKRSATRKIWTFVALGLACLAGGWVWSYWLPLNRHLWTSSMILWSGRLEFPVSGDFLSGDRRGGIQALGLLLCCDRRQRPVCLRLRPVLLSHVQRCRGMAFRRAKPRPPPARRLGRLPAGHQRIGPALAVALVSVQKADLSQGLAAR